MAGSALIPGLNNWLVLGLLLLSGTARGAQRPPGFAASQANPGFTKASRDQEGKAGKESDTLLSSNTKSSLGEASWGLFSSFFPVGTF